ncbi:MAG: class I SAM-dependent methyltransferase [Archaeoglobaceae archaeon]
MGQNWWDRIYREQKPPWDSDEPSTHLVEVIESGEVTPGTGKALDICCGKGTEAVYLAEEGFTVSGIDVSAEAIKMAKEKAESVNVDVDFRVGDVLHMPFKNDSFEFVNDKGCFHVFGPEDRKGFAVEVSRVMKGGGRYMMRCFCDKQPGDYGPYRISREIIIDTFSSLFEIDDIKEVDLGESGSPKGYRVLMTKRADK